VGSPVAVTASGPNCMTCSPASTNEPGGMVATDWAPVIQTGIGALAAIGGGFVGAWVQGRTQQRMEQDRRRERVAEVLAGIEGFLDEAGPGLAILAVHDDPGIRIDDPVATLARLGRQQVELRKKLLILAAGHPNAKVRNEAGVLDLTLADCMASTEELVLRVTGRPPVTRNWANYSVEKLEEIAERDHEDATRILRWLLKAI
jgi:hypothetical protein